MANELDSLDAHQLLHTFLARKAPRYIGSKSTERRDWLKAEEEVTTDFRILATGQRRAKAPPISDSAAEIPKEDVLEAYLETIEAKISEMPEKEAIALAKRTRCLPLGKKGLPDWDGVRELALAWAQSFAYEDGDGDETWVPKDAEELVELWDKHRAGRRPSRKAPDFDTLVEERGEKALEPYTIKKTFQTGDWIEHKKFGSGLVIEAGEKVRVRFSDQERVLIHVPPVAEKMDVPRGKKKSSSH